MTGTNTVVQADTGTMWTCTSLGGPEVPIRTFNQIQMLYVLPVYRNIKLYKIREKFT